MKKTILTSTISLALGAMGTQALGQALIVNGANVDGISVSNFTYNADSNTLEVTTSGGEILMVNDGSGGGTPDPDPGPGPDPDPDPDPGPDLGPVDGVVFDYQIHDWSNDIRGVNMTIPRGLTIASSFTTTDQERLMGGIYFQAMTNASPKVDIWISAEPGGEVLNGNRYCGKQGQSYIYTIEWAQGAGFSWYCILETSKTYYLNIKHEDANAGRSQTIRKIY